MEFLEDVPELDAILAPICGGGMVAGMCVAAKHINPSIKGTVDINLMFAPVDRLPASNW